jgi:hypothetical protein
MNGESTMQMSNDTRPFLPGSRVKVLHDTCVHKPVPVGTKAIVLESGDAFTTTQIEFEAQGKTERTWMWNCELELIDGSRVCGDG